MKKNLENVNKESDEVQRNQEDWLRLVFGAFHY